MRESIWSYSPQQVTTTKDKPLSYTYTSWMKPLVQLLYSYVFRGMGISTKPSSTVSISDVFVASLKHFYSILSAGSFDIPVNKTIRFTVYSELLSIK